MRRTVFGHNKGKPFTAVFDTTKTGTGSTTSTQLKLPLVSDFPYKVDWGDGVINNITSTGDSNLTHTYSTSGEKTVKIFGKILGFKFNNTGDKLKIKSVVDWGDITLNNAAFKGCSNLTLTSVLGIPKTGNFTGLFDSCISLTTINNLHLWTPSGIMAYMFAGCINFNDGGLSNWNMAGIVDIQEMFNSCKKFNQPLNWNTSNITNFTGVFRAASIFNQDITGWSVSQSVKLDNVFDGANAFNQNLGMWTFNKNVSMNRFMIGNTLSTANYDSLLNKFASNVVGTGRTQTYKNLHAGNSKYSVAGQSSRNSLTTDGWFVSDAGLI